MSGAEGAASPSISGDSTAAPRMHDAASERQHNEPQMPSWPLIGAAPHPPTERAQFLHQMWSQPRSPFLPVHTDQEDPSEKFELVLQLGEPPCAPSVHDTLCMRPQHGIRHGLNEACIRREGLVWVRLPGKGEGHGRDRGDQGDPGG